jgi:hypothetical protein
VQLYLQRLSLEFVVLVKDTANIIIIRLFELQQS